MSSKEGPKIEQQREVNSVAEVDKDTQESLAKLRRRSMELLKLEEDGIRDYKALQDNFRARIAKLRTTTPSAENIQAQITRYEGYITRIDQWIIDAEKAKQVSIDGDKDIFELERYFHDLEVRAEIDFEDGDLAVNPKKIN